MIPFDLPGPVSVEALLAACIGLAVFACLQLFWRASLEQRSQGARARAILRSGAGKAGGEASRHRGPQASQPAPGVQPGSRPFKTAIAAPGARDQLNSPGQGGFGAWLAELARPRALAFLLVAGLALGLGFGPITAHAGPGGFLACLIGVLLAPYLYHRRRATRRLRAQERALPEALDLLVICAEAGLSLDAALERVAREIKAAAPELGEELALTAIELTFLPQRRQAFLNLGQRVQLPYLQSVIDVLIQTERFGTPLSQSLRVLAGDFRESRLLRAEERLLRAEEKAARLPALLTIPLILFILPVLFVVLVGPAVIDLYDKVILR